MASESSSSSSVRQKRPLDNANDGNDDNTHTTSNDNADDTNDNGNNNNGGNSAKRSRVDNEATTSTSSSNEAAATGHEDEAEFDENAAVEGLGDVPADDGKGEDDSKEETIEMRSLIESHQVGSVIGTAGKNVKRIREEARVFISVAKVPDPKAVKERVVNVKGKPTGLATAFEILASVLVQAAGLAEEKGYPSRYEAGQTGIRLLVNAAVTGAIIGKAGVVVKEMKTELNVTVRISPDPLPGSTEKSVHVIGTPPQIGKAMARIIKQIHSNPPKAGTTYQPYQPELHPGRSTVGDDLGKRDRAASQAAAGGASSSDSRSATGGGATPPQAYPPYAYPPHGYPPYDPHNPYGGYHGYPPQPGASGSAEGGAQNPYGYPGYPPHMPYGYGGEGGYPPYPYPYPPYGGHYPPMPHHHTSRPSPENMTKQDVAIPTSSAGAVIGAKGMIITNIKRESSTFISIADPDRTNPSERVVSITGTPQGIAKAIQLIRNAIETNGLNPRGGGSMPAGPAMQ